LPLPFAHLRVRIRLSRSVPGRRLLDAPPWSGVRLRPRGSRSGPGYSVPAHQRLWAPSDPLAGTSRFRRLATYTRCLRCAGAPRRPASGSGLSLHIPSRHAVPYVPGEIGIVLIQFLDSDIGLHRDLSGSALPSILPSVSSRARISGLTGSHSLRPVWLLAPLTDRPRFLPATRAFTSRLSTSWSPSSLLDITSTVTGPPLSVGLSPTGICSYPRCTRSVRARLRIRLLPRMNGVEALVRIRMQNARVRNPPVQQWVETVPAHLRALTAAH
jgi:hypothetical protein